MISSLLRSTGAISSKPNADRTFERMVLGGRAVSRYSSDLLNEHAHDIHLWDFAVPNSLENNDILQLNQVERNAIQEMLFCGFLLGVESLDLSVKKTFLQKKEEMKSSAPYASFYTALSEFCLGRVGLAEDILENSAPPILYQLALSCDNGTSSDSQWLPFSEFMESAPETELKFLDSVSDMYFGSADILFISQMRNTFEIGDFDKYRDIIVMTLNLIRHGYIKNRGAIIYTALSGIHSSYLLGLSRNKISNTDLFSGVLSKFEKRLEGMNANPWRIPFSELLSIIHLCAGRKNESTSIIRDALTFYDQLTFSVSNRIKLIAANVLKTKYPLEAFESDFSDFKHDIRYIKIISQSIHHASSSDSVAKYFSLTTEAYFEQLCDQAQYRGISPLSRYVHSSREYVYKIFNVYLNNQERSDIKNFSVLKWLLFIRNVEFYAHRFFNELAYTDSDISQHDRANRRIEFIAALIDFVFEKGGSIDSMDASTNGSLGKLIMRGHQSDIELYESYLGLGLRKEYGKKLRQLENELTKETGSRSIFILRLDPYCCIFDCEKGNCNLAYTVNANIVDDSVQKLSECISEEFSLGFDLNQMNSEVHDHLNRLSQDLLSNLQLTKGEKVKFVLDPSWFDIPINILKYKENEYLCDYIDILLSYGCLGDANDISRQDGCVTRIWSMMSFSVPDYLLNHDSESNVGSVLMRSKFVDGSEHESVDKMIYGWNVKDLHELESEVLYLRDQLGARIFVGADANIDNFRSNAGLATDVHINTHGYYADFQSTQTGVVDFFPLIGTGVLLSGCVDWMNGGDYISPYGSGILTAQQVSILDLRNVECAVLSACWSGKGNANMSVADYGFKAGLRIAGVDSVVSTHWPALVVAAKVFSETFFCQRKKHREKAYLAFRTAQAVVREKYSNPLIWGCFSFEQIG